MLYRLKATCKVVPAAITSSQQTAVVQMQDLKKMYFKLIQTVTNRSIVTVNFQVTIAYVHHTIA